MVPGGRRTAAAAANLPRVRGLQGPPPSLGQGKAERAEAWQEGAKEAERAEVIEVLAASSSNKRKAEAEPSTDDDTIVELGSIEDRVQFAFRHGIPCEQGIQDTLEEDLDYCGVPERYAMVRPPGFKPYPRQKPGIEFFPSDHGAVYVVSEKVFGSVSSQ